jgi:hypothetical protein
MLMVVALQCVIALLCSSILSLCVTCDSFFCISLRQRCSQGGVASQQHQSDASGIFILAFLLSFSSCHLTASLEKREFKKQTEREFTILRVNKDFRLALAA